MNILTKFKFAMKHPTVTLRYLLGDKKAVYYQKRRDIVDNAIRTLGIRERTKLNECLVEFDRNVNPIIKRSLDIYKKADPSSMRFYKAPLLYCLIRLIRPAIVVETGVASGISSLSILQALNRNDYGHLYSIDLPNVEPESSLPNGYDPGWVIPESLRKSWTLILGDSREQLPRLLRSLKSIDVFIHDSLHTYDHMLFEFRVSWPFINVGGLLISDDIEANSAFNDFVKELRAEGHAIKHHVSISGLGIIKRL